ncbi:hypothetical protein EXIGLDRAFT_509894 [Exidia glandulosa HHB12029]|uniref:Uncharacterized protein n=1 Tax=Exidia glandulosa HHB12029 TaxID=1314781 RepID=A0A165PDU4_EXIGL|nr:hypothetical protein EXIGLDRAFT_509894 [Exidia glandulosa HHB12029]
MTAFVAKLSTLPLLYSSPSTSPDELELVDLLVVLSNGLLVHNPSPHGPSIASPWPTPLSRFASAYLTITTPFVTLHRSLARQRVPHGGTAMAIVVLSLPIPTATPSTHSASSLMVSDVISGRNARSVHFFGAQSTLRCPLGIPFDGLFGQPPGSNARLLPGKEGECAPLRCVMCIRPRPGTALMTHACVMRLHRALGELNPRKSLSALDF